MSTEGVNEHGSIRKGTRVPPWKEGDSACRRLSQGAVPSEGARQGSSEPAESSTEGLEGQMHRDSQEGVPRARGGAGGWC